jgi:diaminohydroxyphosphoribosylaminopyrimidine deaminase/5-amino-6-(5-phosphoribosylamino)uracil reductase
VAPPSTNPDSVHLRRALALAEQSIGLSEPNPRVGCVIVGAGGQVLAEGFTQRAGGAHAEIAALREAANRGADVRGATVHVTLEPCSHHGRTPPCCDALIAAGVGRVVVAIGDPNPQVAGGGLERLREAGIAVTMGDADIADAARELNIGFFSRMVHARPWVRVKAAASLDGRTALDNGESQWITGHAARADGHAWRRRAGAVLTGIGTVLADDPRLDVREVDTAVQPLRAVVDSQLRTPPGARLLAPPGRAVVFTCSADAARAATLTDRGAEVVRVLPREARVDLPSVLAELAALEVNELHVEAGASLAGALLAQDLVDEWLIYLAPKLIGPGRGIAAFGPIARLSQAAALEFVDVERTGDDLRIRARPSGRAVF